MTKRLKNDVNFKQFGGQKKVDIYLMLSWKLKKHK
jgi:hypothetical protein